MFSLSFYDDHSDAFEITAGLLVAAGSPALEAGAGNSPGDHPG